LTDSALRKTPLFESHKSLGAKFTEFGGWEMPVRYTSLKDEHECVRTKVGLFDVSHMGEIFVSGKGALSFLQLVTTNDLSKISHGQAQYALLCNEKGGVVDDIISYFIRDDFYMLCVNAANCEKDFVWLNKQLENSGLKDVNLDNASADYGQIAIQGPSAEKLLEKVMSLSLSDLSAFSFLTIDTDNSQRPTLIARTGYTGEDGFEVFSSNQETKSLWQSLLEQGEEFGVQAIGLGARDTLRLEVAYPLHGHELTDDLIALSSNVSWTIKLKKGEFIGREALATAKQSGVKHKLKGFSVDGRGIVREGAKIFDDSGKEIGWVSSGTMTPTVGKAVALAFVDVNSLKNTSAFKAEVRGKMLNLKLEKLPFYRREK